MKPVFFTLKCLLVSVLTTLGVAQELLPELAPSANLHKANSTQLGAQKALAHEAVQMPYLTALNAADQTATASGNVASVRAIAKEREAVVKGGLAESLPPELPKTVGPARKAFFRGYDRVEAEFAQKQKALDATYLKLLASLQSKAASNPTLAKQIDAEKQRLLAGIYGPLTDLRTGIDGTTWKDAGRWAKSGGTVTFKAGIYNKIWKYETPAPNKVKIFWSAADTVTFVLDKDGKTLLEGGERRFELMTPKTDK